MLSRLHRMSAGMVRFLFRQHLQKIHAPHLMARVFFFTSDSPLPHFLKDGIAGARFSVLLPRGSYKNSIEMHAQRRAVYNAVRIALAEIQKEGRIIPPCICGIVPKNGFFQLSGSEQEADARKLLQQFFPQDL